MSNASHLLSLLYQFHKNHRCMMYYVCFLPLSLCMMNHSGDNHICGLKTKQRTSKMTLSIWQEKIETKWLENYSPKMFNSSQNKWSGLFNPDTLKGYLLPWTITAIDRKCKTSSQLSLRDQLLFWMDKRSFKNLFFTFRSRVVNSGYCKDVRESLELKGR